MRKLKLFFAALALLVGGSNSVWAETDYTSLMSSDWTGSTGDFGGGKERYQGANYTANQKVMYQSFTAPAAGIYEIKFYAVTSCTASRYAGSIFGDNIAQAYATAGNNKATVAMTVINQTGCTLVADANIRTLSVEAAEGETIEYGLENIAEGGNWYTIKELSAKMKTVAEIFQAQYDEAYAIWQNSTENEDGARATFKAAVDAMNTALSGTLADAQTASDNLAAALVTYESKSYPIKGNNVKYDFTNKMNMAINAWTCKQGNGPNQYGFTGATETYGNTTAGEVMYQTITGLANGEYEIHFYAVANAANGGGVEGTKTTVYANDQELEIDVIKQSGCTPSDYERTFTVMVKDGTLKYGIKNTGAAGNWYLCKNVALYMTGAPDLSDYYDAISEKLTTANGLITSPMMNTVLSALQAAIDDTEGYTEITVTSQLETLSDNLTTAITNANTSIGNYTAALTILNAASSLDATVQTIYAANTTVADLQAAYDNRTLDEVTSEQETECASVISNYNAWTTLKADAEVLKAVENDNATANGTFATAISDQDAAVEAATTATDIETAIATLKDAMTTYVGEANPVGDDAKFDCTFMLTNPDLSVFKTNGTQAGWYTDQTFNAQNSQVMQSNGDVANSTDNTKFAMYEYWSDASCATSGYTVYTKVTLPEGTYRMDALCMSRWGWNASQENGARNITFSAGDVDGTSIVTSTLEPATLGFVQASEGEVKIGLKAHDGNTCNWMGIGYVQLFKVPAVTVTIEENVTYTPESKAGNVTLVRTLSTEKWNTFVVPFQIKSEELKEAFGDNVLVAEYSEAQDPNNLDDSYVTFTKMETPAISPNKPVLLKPSTVADNNTYVFANRTIATDNPVVNGTENFDFVGTYAATTTIAEGNFFISNNKLYKSEGHTNISGTRAYLKAKSAEARITKFFIDGEETTAIEGLKMAGNSGKIYNLNGQEVKNAGKGIFIQNGKKIVVK